MGLIVYRIDWFRIIADLERAGLTDTRISEEIGCHKANISKYKAGTEPLHHLGEKLRALHLKHCLSIQPARTIVPQPYHPSPPSGLKLTLGST